MIRYDILRLIVLILSIASLCCGAPSLAAEISKKIDEKTALKLLTEATGEKPAEFDYEGDNSKATPSFFIFIGLASVQGFSGYYAVNSWTGDVWALWGCHKLVSEDSRFTQTEIFKRFTRKERKQYTRLSELSPECIYLDDLAEAGH